MAAVRATRPERHPVNPARPPSLLIRYWFVAESSESSEYHTLAVIGGNV
jgi:hypothetical protein